MQKMQMCHNTYTFIQMLVFDNLETVEIVSFYQTIIQGTPISFSIDVQQKSFF